MGRAGSSPRPAPPGRQQRGAGRLALRQRADEAAQDRAAVKHRRGERCRLAAVAVAGANPDLELGGEPEGDVAENVERLGFGDIGGGLEWLALRLAAIAWASGAGSA